FIICLIFFLNLIFCTLSFATLYIVKDQEGNNICITNKENEISKYKLLGYEIVILGGSEQEISESTEKEINKESQIIPETENISESNIVSLSKVDLIDFNTSFTPKGDFVNIQGTLRNYGKEIINNAEINVKCKNEKGKMMTKEEKEWYDNIHKTLLERKSYDGMTFQKVEGGGNLVKVNIREALNQ
ncbi:MAG: hypothetical protein KGD67_12310, partial [Candidatus Lokiarchaeota archaeon]|nr:hypothetical protein [Candidatus Lokiarchaeota archaeon]